MKTAYLGVDDGKPRTNTAYGGLPDSPIHASHSQPATPEEVANLRSFFSSLHVMLFEHGLVPEHRQPRERASRSHNIWLIKHYAACPFCWMDAHPE